MCDQLEFDPRIPGGGTRRCRRPGTITLHCTEKTYDQKVVRQEIRRVCDLCAVPLLAIRPVPPTAFNRPKTYWSIRKESIEAVESFRSL